ncbi:MFS siderochrome iron transporter 1 [Cladobotryum mycophilum]|uniref:MFS siderochrome iron transporter 1 n=1 Tax=Cladobotryum mycophilum TaxID=491253 RepID=A0ABR0SVC0_9HYPO
MAALEQGSSSSSSGDSAASALPDYERGDSGELDLVQLNSQSLSLYEKKCVLVNRAIDAQGMGRYQWYIWLLCGSGYFLDLLWAQAFALVLSPLQQELGFSNDQSGNISTSFNAGLTAGAFFWGFISDIIGRRWAFNLTCLFSSVFGLCLGASNTYNTFLVLTAFVGFGVGGNIPVDTTIFLEFVPRDKRFLLACLSIFQPIGVVICSALAFAFIPNYSCSPNFSETNPLPACNSTVADGAAPCCARSANKGWRYLLYTAGAVSLLIFTIRFFVFNFKETPKYLLYRGQDEKAAQTIAHMAKVNKRETWLTADIFKILDSEDEASSASASNVEMEEVQQRKGVAGYKTKMVNELERYKLLFDGFQMTRLTILTWLTYIMDFWGFTVAGFYLPRILAIKNGAAKVSLKFTYASYIYTYAPGTLGVLLGAWSTLIPSVGRKWSMVVSSGLMGASIFAFSAVDTVAKNSGLFAMEYFFQSMFNAVLYGWTPEAFPAPIRGTACGVASFWGRLFGIVSPLIAQHLYGQADGANSVLYLAGGVTLGCVITTALLPSELMEAQDEHS